jgi:glycosyltransferase involved in cell wall biosynthesis
LNIQASVDPKSSSDAHDDGEAAALADEAAPTHAGEASALRQRLAAQERQLGETNRKLAEHISAVGALRDAVHARDGELTAHRYGLAEHIVEIGALRQTLGARESELVAARQSLAERAAEIGLLRQTLSMREGELAAAKQGFAGRSDEFHALKRAVGMRRDELAAARQSLAVRIREAGALRQTLDARRGELIAARRDLTKRATEIDRQKREIETLRTYVETLRSALETGDRRIERLDDTISAIYASTSWRITAPVRVARRLAAGSGPPGTHAPAGSLLSLVGPSPPPGADFALAGDDARQSFDSSAPDYPSSPIQDHMSPVRDPSAAAEEDFGMADFDPVEYLEIHPDVKAAGFDPVEHYVEHGRAEGRRGRLPDFDLHPEIDPARETVLIVFHEGTRTGAPILGYNLVLAFLKKYNVISMFLGRGPLLDACAAAGAVVIGPLPKLESALTVLLGRVIDAIPIKFAIVNSIPSYFVLPALAQHFVPNVTLSHEFASYIRPSAAFLHVALWSGNVIFSSRTTMENAWSLHPELRGKAFPVLAQGRCVVPGGNGGRENRRQDGHAPPPPSASGRSILQLMPPRSDGRNMVLVLGAGSVEYRKGVDLFIDCAARIRKQRPDLPIRFVWIGNGYAPEADYGYSVFLADQIMREELDGRVFIVDAVEDLSPAYAAADIFLLSSRLDPLPNVTIDALYEGIPVVCFGSGNGMADILRRHGLGDVCVARDMEENDMASKVIALASSAELRRRVGAEAVALAEKAFNMTAYVAGIEELVAQTAAPAQQERADIWTIAEAAVARADFFLPSGAVQDAGRAVRRYVRSWAAGVQRRKLFPGFHPGIYLERHGIGEPGTDPLADFLRNGRPQGPWTSTVIAPAGFPAPIPANLRIALHIHAYYPDLLSEILDAISVNVVRPDLLVSVGSHAGREQVSALLDGYAGGAIDIRVVPNRGRDLGPLLTEFKDRIRDGYDIIGHFHTKTSVDVRDREAAAVWRTFLVENLLGGRAPMIDTIIGSMAADREIGMVFPDDPNVIGWGVNRPFAEAMARQLALGDLPEYLNFPVGSMFWADVASLHGFFKLDLKWQDYPDEPLPYDGSVLHAIERLISLAAVAAGKKVALTNVPGVTR